MKEKKRESQPVGDESAEVFETQIRHLWFPDKILG